MNIERDEYICSLIGFQRTVTGKGSITSLPCDFDTWPGFGFLWKWAESQIWWPDFILHVTKGDSVYYNLGTLPSSFINPTKFADVISNYSKAKEKFRLFWSKRGK